MQNESEYPKVVWNGRIEGQSEWLRIVVQDDNGRHQVERQTGADAMGEPTWERQAPGTHLHVEAISRATVKALVHLQKHLQRHPSPGGVGE